MRLGMVEVGSFSRQQSDVLIFLRIIVLYPELLISCLSVSPGECVFL